MKAKQRSNIRHVFAQPFWQHKTLSLSERLMIARRANGRAADDRKNLLLGKPIEQNP